MDSGSVEQHPDPIIRWKHRRAMAYIALAGGLAYPLLILLTEADALVGIAWLFYVFVGSSVWETVKIAATTNRSK